MIYRFVDDFFENPRHNTFETDEPVANVLERPMTYIDEDGYEVRLWAGAVHPDTGWIAWVDYYKKRPPGQWVDCNYYLRIKVEDVVCHEWTVETYNPYFGCFPGYLSWHGDKVVFVYWEKHRVYGTTLSCKGLEKRIELGKGGAQFCVRENTVFVRRADRDRDKVQRYQIPEWETLPDWTQEEALQHGILELVK